MTNGTIIFEILRDVWQTVSLILEQIEDKLSGIISKIFSFGAWSYLTSLCFSCYFNDEKLRTTVSQWLFIIQSIFAIGAVFAFRSAAHYDLKYDQEDMWTPKMRGTTRKLVYGSTLILTTIYLPLVRDVTKILACDQSFIGETYLTSLDIYECYTDMHWLFIFGAVSVGFIYIIWTPFLLYSVIDNKKPKPVYFDKTGEYKQFTDEDYRNEISKQTKNPYKSLYSGYQREWAHYKVITMIFKLVLTIPAALLVSENYLYTSYSNYNYELIRNACILTVLVLFTVQSMCSKPFIDTFNNKMDQSTRIMAVILSLVALLFILINPEDILQLTFSVFIGIINGLLVLITIYGMLKGSKWIRKKYKKLKQELTFTMNYTTNKPLILYHYKDKLNFCKERKINIWYKFWDSIFENDSLLRIPPKEGIRKKAIKTAQKTAKKAAKKAKKSNNFNYVPINVEEEEKAIIQRQYEPKELEISYEKYKSPYLMNFEFTAGERHEENKLIVQNVGVESYKTYIDSLVEQLINDSNILIMFKKITTALQGKDVYWEGPAAFVEKIDARLNRDNPSLANINMFKSQSNTHFGKLSLSPFPFLARLEFDEGEVAIFSLAPIVASRKNVEYQNMMHHLFTLVNQNENTEVLRRKKMRLRFRAMVGTKCQWRIQRYIYKRISRTVTKEDYNYITKQNETKQETEYKNVQVLFTFNVGTFTLQEKGFKISLQYHDGTGSYYESGWGNFSWSNEHYSLPGSEIGINYSYNLTQTLQRFFNANWNPQAWKFENNMINIQNDWHNKRMNKCKEYAKREEILSYAFWYYLYNDDSIPFQYIHVALQCESNVLIRELTAKYDNYFNMLFETYLNFYNSSYVNSFWFLFWNDIWQNNQDIKMIKENPKLFNNDLLFQVKRIEESKENEIECIALNIKSKKELIVILKELKLYGQKGWFRNGWFNENIIDTLYVAMDDLKSSDENLDIDDTKQNLEDVELHISGNIKIKTKTSLTDGPKYNLQEFRHKYCSASTLMRNLFISS